MKISLCMIVKNEEAVLGRCLESVHGVDEIIVVDTGSTDRTVEIAKSYGAAVHFFAWRDDFAAARNFAFSKATGDYLFWLDADDVLPPNADMGAMRALLERENPDMVMCTYVSGKLTYERERFLRRDGNFLWVGRVHECIAPRGKIMRDRFRVVHLPAEKKDSHRNLDIYRRWAGEETLAPRDLFYYGRELYYHRLYTEAQAVLLKMLGTDGWYVNKIEACNVLSLCMEALGDTAGALEALFRSFLYGEPRAEILCRIGAIKKREKKYAEAVFWYEGALRCRDHSAEGDFEQAEKRGLVPLLELVVCYYALGDRDKSIEYHTRTEAIAPEHPSVRFNRKFFDKIVSKS